VLAGAGKLGRRTANSKRISRQGRFRRAARDSRPRRMRATMELCDARSGRACARSARHKSRSRRHNSPAMRPCRPLSRANCAGKTSPRCPATIESCGELRGQGIRRASPKIGWTGVGWAGFEPPERRSNR